MKKGAYNFLLKNKDNNILLKNIYESFIDGKELNIEQLSKDSFLSKSSISRYFTKNGFDGFSEFKFLLLNEIEDNILTEKNFSSLEQKMIFNPIKKTSTLNTHEQFEKIYELLLKSNNNYILGAGANATICYELKNRLDRFGFNADTNQDLHGFYVKISNCKLNDLLWVFSYTGETKEIIRIVELAKSKNIKIISITRKSKNSIVSLSDLNLYVDSSENLIRTLSIKSRMSMFYLVSKLVLYIYLQNPKLYNQKLIDSLY